MTSDTSGRQWRTPLAFYDPDTSSWKTSGAIFPSDWPTSSQTCPGWGMTRGGELFELPTPALPTAERECSSLLPTPAAQEPGGTAEAHLWRKNRLDGANRVTPTHLAFITDLLPTPMASAGTKGSDRRGPNAQGGPSLAEEVALLATPRVASARTSAAATRQGSRSGPSLEQCVEIGRGELPREFTSWKELPPSWRGASTNPRFAAGSKSPDGQPHDQLSLGEPAND